MNRPVRDFFEEEVDSYSSLFDGRKTGVSYNFARRAAIIRELMHGRSGYLLDCAIGSGEVTKAAVAAGNFHSATLLDISASMLEKAKRLFDPADGELIHEFVETDVFAWLEKAQGEGKLFDTVLCIGLIAHTGRLPELLELIRGVLTPNGGQLFLQSTLAGHPGTRIVRMATAKRYAREKGYEISYFKACDIRKTARSSGLRVVDERRFGLGIPFGDRIMPRANYQIEAALSGLAGKFGSEGIFVISE
jgi:ubiquinone/menaquinone biosynthesis C-methylase UbiE